MGQNHETASKILVNKLAPDMRLQDMGNSLAWELVFAWLVHV